MPIDILMPALSPTMIDGKVSRWLKNEGDAVKAGDILAEIETDKATMEVEAVDEGVLGKILIAEGTEGVKVNQPIAILLGDGESAALVNQTSSAQAASAPLTPMVNSTLPPAAFAKNIPTPPQNGVAHSDHAIVNRILASPLARRIAEQNHLDLYNITGSGPHGRIVKTDIEAALRNGSIAARSPPSQPAVSTTLTATSFTLVPHTTMRKVIAKRLTQATQTIPTFYLTIECDIGRLLKLRGELNAYGEKAGFKLSVNDFVVRAAALALRRKQEVNAAWSDDGIIQFHSVDVAIAVALPAGLITPIIFNADAKTLPEISNAAKVLFVRAKENKLKPEEFQGGTFSISNLGMFGIKEFTAIINPPQSCILAVGVGGERAVVRGGKIEIANMMNCTLSCDHRVVDGALGAEFLSIFKELIENPLGLLV